MNITYNLNDRRWKSAERGCSLCLALNNRKTSTPGHFPACVCFFSLTAQNIFRLYCSGSSGPVLLLLHGGGHSALSWAVFTVSLIITVAFIGSMFEYRPGCCGVKSIPCFNMFSISLFMEVILCLYRLSYAAGSTAGWWPWTCELTVVGVYFSHDCFEKWNRFFFTLNMNIC